MKSYATLRREQQNRGSEQKVPTFPVRAGMFMELVAKPIPKAMADSTPRNLATNCSRSSWMSKFPVSKSQQGVLQQLLLCVLFTRSLLKENMNIIEHPQKKNVHIK